MKARVTCDECGRVFDLEYKADAYEWSCGHDCEAPKVCMVCGDTGRRCAFGNPHGLCSCWRGVPCQTVDTGRAHDQPVGSPT